MATTGNAAQGALEEPVLAGLRIPNNTNVNINNNNNTAQFGAVRDRLFHAMLIRFAVSYDHRVPQKLRQLFEFTVLAMAIFLLLSLVYVHVVVSRHPANCFDHIRDTWPREGVLRIEVINNLKEVRLQEELSRTFPQNKTSFNLKKILIGGPNAIPLAARFRRAVEPVVAEPSDNFRSFLQFWLFNGAVVSSQDADDSFWHYFLRPVQYGHDESDNEFSELARSFGYEGPFVDEERSTNDYRIMYEYVVEYSLLFGLLRLPQSYRMEKGIPYMVVQVSDPLFAGFVTFLARCGRG
ncbi:hypothetical protein L596_002830 [Steinernema carpocapsae]|uniref:Uncharacterized protein n=1 Tax=Steinernema carpocapsae TaxID=34508 RepID=A0A4U8UQM7_STECR|nr:hypothetical protein L596_002830 [Steinernema carpocapsae]